MDPVVALAVLALLLLGGLWVVHLRRDLARRAARASEWDAEDGDDDLWTSQVRCVRCEATGALMSREDGQLWHTCMACGHRHARAHQA